MSVCLSSSLTRTYIRDYKFIDSNVPTLKDSYICAIRICDANTDCAGHCDTATIMTAKSSPFIGDMEIPSRAIWYYHYEDDCLIVMESISILDFID